MMKRYPDTWSTCRVKQIFEERKEVTATGDEDLLSVSEYYGVARRKDKMEDDEEFESRAESLDGYKICKKGDLVINIMLAWKCGLGVSNYDGIVSPAYGVYKPIKSIYSQFYHYLFRTKAYTQEFKRNSKGIIDSRLRMYTDRFYNIEVPLPPLHGQKKIADYLDEKTATIDTQVSLLEQKAKKYEQLKKSLISRTVTRGLNKDVRLKDSGIDWIGQIPEHWEVKRGKDLLKITNGFPADSNLFDTDGVGIPLIRIRDINSCSTEVTYAGTDYTKDFLINRGDLLVGMDGDFNSANWKGDTALLNQRVCKIESRKLESRYLSYIITFPLLEINAQKVLTTVKHLASSDLYEISLPLPPISEQQAIAGYLDKKTAEIDSAIANINQQIEKYKLLRRALINEVVTGQRNVN